MPPQKLSSKLVEPSAKIFTLNIFLCFQFSSFVGRFRHQIKIYGVSLKMSSQLFVKIDQNDSVPVFESCIVFTSRRNLRPDASSTSSVHRSVICSLYFKGEPQNKKKAAVRLVQRARVAIRSPLILSPGALVYVILGLSKTQGYLENGSSN